MKKNPSILSSLSDKAKTVGKDITSVTSAGVNQHHAVKSILENGAIAHHGAVAAVLMAKGAASSEFEAVEMANTLMKEARAVANGELWHREARFLLDAQARERAHASPKATQPSCDLEDVGVFGFRFIAD